MPNNFGHYCIDFNPKIFIIFENIMCHIIIILIPRFFMKITKTKKS